MIGAKGFVFLAGNTTRTKLSERSAIADRQGTAEEQIDRVKRCR